MRKKLLTKTRVFHASSPSVVWLRSFTLIVAFLVSGVVMGQSQPMAKASKMQKRTIATDKIDKKTAPRDRATARFSNLNKNTVNRTGTRPVKENPVYGPMPQDDRSPLDVVKGKKEVLSKRDISSKHYRNDDGSHTALIGAGPIHYDHNGTWEDIDHTITTSSDIQYPYANTTNLMESHFGATATLGVLNKTKEGTIREFLNTKMYWEVNGQAIQVQNSADVAISIEGDRAYYHNLFGNISAEFTILSGKRKLNYIIPNAAALGNIPANAEYLVFSEAIVLPNGWNHVMDTKKGVLINDASGTAIFAYETPRVYENYTGRLLMPEKNNPAFFTVTKNGNTLSIILKVKTEWLLDTERIFPLAIDPTVNVYPDNAVLWSGWVESSGFGGNDNMYVGYDNNYENDAFIKFNLSSIPIGSDIITVASSLYRRTGLSTGSTNTDRQMVIGGCNVDPVTAVFWIDIFNGYTGNISNAVSANNLNGYKTNTFTPAGITYIENALVNGEATILALPTGTWGATNYAGFDGYADANRPYLTINYTIPVGPCIPTSEDPEELYINSVSIVGTLSDPPTNISTNSANGYQDFTNLSPLAVQAQGEGVNILANATGEVLERGTWKAWVDWNQNDTFEPSEEVYNIQGFVGASVTFGFEIPPTQAPGDYRLRIRVNNSVLRYEYWWGGYDFDGEYFYEGFGFDFNACEPFGTVNEYLDSYIDGFYVVDVYYDRDIGETEDYLFTVIENCDAQITEVIGGETCNSGTVTLNVTATPGASINWYYDENDTTPFQNTAQGNWTTPTLNSTTTYWVAAYDGCESIVRVPIVATINPTPTVTFTPANPILCGNEIIQITAQGDTETSYLIDEDFEDGNLGDFQNINNDANNAATDNLTRFQNLESVYVPTTNVNVWYPAISSGFGPNNFALALSDAADPNYPAYGVQNSLALTNAVDATDFNTLTLDLKLYYSRYFPANTYPDDEYVAIEVSTDGGVTYPNVIDTFTENMGLGSNFASLSYDLSAYIGEPNLKIRVRHFSHADINGWLPDGIAVDDIKLYGEKPLNTAFNYDTATIDAFEDAAATIPYIPHTPATTIYIRPTLTQMESPSFIIPVDAVLSNGCSATGNVTITNNTKVWSGLTDNDWNDPYNWRPNGVPTSDNCVIVIDNGTYDDPDISEPPLPPGPAFAKNLIVKNNAQLELYPETSLTVTDWIEVEPNGILSLRNSASLVQVNDTPPKPNSGTIHVQRAPKSDFTSVGNLNYVYWSSPVDNFNISQVSPGTPASLIWEWNPTIPGNGIGDHGDWQNATGTMAPGKGYIVRGLSGTPAVIPSTTITVENNTALFSGEPRNGSIVVPITRGIYTGVDYGGIGNTATAQDDNWNLLGNPYPSAISANDFVTANTAIDGTTYLWPHETLPNTGNDDPFYGDFGVNYANSYIEHNPTGTVPPDVGDEVYIASGQAFMVLMMDGGSTNETVTFNNSLRHGAHPNNLFYRQNGNPDTAPEKHRIWLDLVDANNNAQTLLVGYIEDATNAVDRLYDGYNFVNRPANFYSMIGDVSFTIQGRALPFSQEDIVPLGLTVQEAGTYRIGINTLDGLFDATDQNIYLEDLWTQTIHDLRASPYLFTTESGTHDKRFVLRYTDQTLDIPDGTANSGLVIIGVKDHVSITSTANPINTITIYDVLGRVLADYKNVNQLEFKIDLSHLSNGTLIVKATLYNGRQNIKKIIH